MTRRLALALSLIAALPAQAGAPESSLRPVARPGATAAPAPARTDATALRQANSTRPKPRPAAREAAPETSQPAQRVAEVADADPQTPAQAQQRDSSANLDRPGAASKPQAGNGLGLFKSLRPALRSNKVQKEAQAIKQARQKGSVCGDPAIQGTPVGRVTGHIKGCVIENAVSVKSVSGIGLTQRSVMDCTTAKTFRRWVDQGLKPSVGSHRGGIARMKIAAHYSCRTRYGRKGTKLSEHGKGRAIDISGFTFRDGTQITLTQHWNHKVYGKMLRNMWRTACGPFGTVLGPNSNAAHRDHFHFDTARYRSGSYCR